MSEFDVDEVVQVVMTGRQFAGFVDMIAAYGMTVGRIPVESTDIPTYCVTPTDESLRRAGGTTS